MYIQPLISVKYQQKQPSYRGKQNFTEQILNPQKLSKQLDSLKTASPEVQQLFRGLSAVAGSLIAGFAMYAEKNEEVINKINNFLQEAGLGDVQQLFEKVNDAINIPRNEVKEEEKVQLNYDVLLKENQQRKKYLAITSKYFPNLNSKYEELLYKYQKEPENQENKLILDTLETIFGILSNDEGLKYRKRYFEALDQDYINCLENVCQNFRSTVIGGQTPMQYLVMLHNGTIKEDDINKWAEAKNLDLDEIMLLRDLDKKALVNISNVKEKNNNFRITFCNAMDVPNYNMTTYALKYKFKEGLSIAEKLKIITKVHEAIYGKICFKEQTTVREEFFKKDVQTEMLDGLVKDSMLDAVFNLAKYLDKKKLKKLSLTTEDVKFLSKDSPRYQKLKDICTNMFLNLDFEDYKVKTLLDVLSDREIFGELFESRHARLRFISRIVLKDNPSADLKKETKEKMDIFLKELNDFAETRNYFCYLHPRGVSPQFYIKDSQLGKFVKVTLNDNGTIHTLFEDFRKETKEKENDKNEKLNV